MLETILGKKLKFEIKSIDEESKTVTAVVSHIKGDRDGDIIPPEAMRKRLKSYKEHPVLLADHTYDNEHTIGQAKSIKLNDDHVEAKLEYFAGMKNDDDSPKNPQADWAWELAKRGLGAYSIGFKAYDYEWIKEKVKDGDNSYDMITGRNFKDIELLEISHVVVPANANALQHAIDDKETPSERRELCELVLKKMKAGEIKGPKLPGNGIDINNDTEQVDDNSLNFIKNILPKAFKHISKLLKDESQEQDATEQRRMEEMEKRMSACEASVSKCEATYEKLEAMIENINETLAGLMNADDDDDDGLNNSDPKSKSGKHYSDNLFGSGPTKTKQTPKESVVTVNRLAGVGDALKRTLTEIQKDIPK